MSFVIKERDGIVSIVCKEGDKALTYVSPLESLSGKCEYYISNSSVTKVEEPYYSVEQALDDFEYITSTIPNKVVLSFKGKSGNIHITETSALGEEFKVEADDEGFCNLIDYNAKCQLSFYPASNTITGEPEYTITSLNFEPIEDYEVLAESFTTEFEEAIQMFEAVVGAIPEDFIDKFQDKINSIE